ncbi:MAG: FtsL-like putative cell division protein [Bacteroidales bacterium]|nr:FtsL-like putative cell division protein [Bacteroidales bacterium]
MANVRKKETAPKATDKVGRKKTFRREAPIWKWMKSLFSGDYFFSRNLRRSPLWFILYCVCLILIYVGLKYEPVKRVRKINEMSDILEKRNARNNDLKAKIQLYTTPEYLFEDVFGEQADYREVYSQPTLIKVHKRDGKSK